MELGIRGRTALVTGGSRGIGRAIAESLAAEGVNLVLVARDQQRLAAFASSTRAVYGVDVTTIIADMAAQETPARLVAQTGPVDILVNNANTPSGGSLEGLEETQWMHNWAVKPFGYIRTIRAFLPAMRQRGSGVIVNMIGQINQVATNKAIYSAASCSALTTVTQALAHDLAGDGLRIVGVSAWVVNTEAVVEGYRQKALVRFGNSERWRELTTHLPYGCGAEPHEVGDLIAFLVSDRARYINGQVINIDGGYVASTLPTLASGPLAHE